MLGFLFSPGTSLACRRKHHPLQAAQRLPRGDRTGRVCEGYLYWRGGLEGEISITNGANSPTKGDKKNRQYLIFVTLWVDLICAGGGGCTRRVGGAET